MLRPNVNEAKWFVCINNIYVHVYQKDKVIPQNHCKSGDYFKKKGHYWGLSGQFLFCYDFKCS